jgi:hypothetical protein
MGVDRPPEEEVKVLMPIEAYETAEMRLSGREWYCWSISLGSYWKPDAADMPDQWPGHNPGKCGWFTEPPEPFEATA